jgi:hypothetical protein
MRLLPMSNASPAVIALSKLTNIEFARLYRLFRPETEKNY